MQKSIQADGRIIVFSIRKRKRVKYIRISVNCDGVFVTQPVSAPFAHIEEIVHKRFSWIIEKMDFFRTYAVSRKKSHEEFKMLREDALYFIQQRLAYFNAVYRCTIANVSIRNQRTRWGSCSHKGNLSFNYRIIELPSELADYVIVHELCHLQELNHLNTFWRLVEKTIPDYRELRRKLKKIIP